VLQLLDSVKIQETAAIALSRPVHAALGSRGRLFVADAQEARIVEIGRDGKVVRTFGEKGQGPGEFVAPGSMLVQGDTLLFVFDNRQRRVTVFDLRSNRFAWDFPLNAFLPSMRVVGSELLASSLDPAAGAAVVVVSLKGEPRRIEGIVPPIAKRLPMLASAVPHVIIATRDKEVFATYDLTQSLYRWPANARAGQEVLMPTTLRRGVKESLYDDMVRDPANAGALLYAHSVPSVLEFVSRGTIASVTLDADLVDRRRGVFAGAFFLSLVDVDGVRICDDVPVTSIQKPTAIVAMNGTTLITLQQADDGTGDVVYWMRRFRVDERRCTWRKTAARDVAK